MAEDKKSFVLYCDYREHLQLLSDSERGQLFTAILDYANDDEIGELPPMVKMAFSFIKSQMDKDAEKYAQIVKARSEAGKKSAAAKQQRLTNGNENIQPTTEPKPEDETQRPPTNGNKNQQNQQTITSTNEIQQSQQTLTNPTDNVNVNDNVNVFDDVDVISPPLTPRGGRGGNNDVYIERFKEFWAAYPKKIGKDAALKAFMKRKPSADLVSKMITAIEWQKQTDQWTRESGRYIPNPATWINQGRWEDEPPAPTVSQSANSNGNPHTSQNPFINAILNGGGD